LVLACRPSVSKKKFHNVKLHNVTLSNIPKA
jgi:hypothetical protein